MTRPIIPWIGGKRRLAKHLLPLFPEHRCYVEPFAGAAALFFMKEPSKVEVINDINGELINLYRVIQNHLDEFIRQFRHSLVSRQVYEWHQMTATETLTDIQRAARFYYLQKMSFGGKVSGQTFGTATTSPPRLNLLRIEEDLSTAHLRLQRAFIEHLPWLKVCEKYARPHSLIYMDPPYWETEGYGVDFGMEQYQQMADFAISTEAAVIISVNDHPAMREVFAELAIQTVDIKYTVGVSVEGGSGKKAKELIISNAIVQKHSSLRVA